MNTSILFSAKAFRFTRSGSMLIFVLVYPLSVYPIAIAEGFMEGASAPIK